VVAISFGIQIWSQNNATRGRFFKTSYMPFADCFRLLALGSIPMLVLGLGVCPSIGRSRVPGFARADARRRDAGDAGTSSRSGNAADTSAKPEPKGRMGVARRSLRCSSSTMSPHRLLLAPCARAGPLRGPRSCKPHARDPSYYSDSLLAKLRLKPTSRLV
jgi:hypothetical protein